MSHTRTFMCSHLLQFWRQRAVLYRAWGWYLLALLLMITTAGEGGQVLQAAGLLLFSLMQPLVIPLLFQQDARDGTLAVLQTKPALLWSYVVSKCSSTIIILLLPFCGVALAMLAWSQPIFSLWMAGIYVAMALCICAIWFLHAAITAWMLQASNRYARHSWLAYVPTAALLSPVLYIYAHRFVPFISAHSAMPSAHPAASTIFAIWACISVVGLLCVLWLSRMVLKRASCR